MSRPLCVLQANDAIYADNTLAHASIRALRDQLKTSDAHKSALENEVDFCKRERMELFRVLSLVERPRAALFLSQDIPKTSMQRCSDDLAQPVFRLRTLTMAGG